MKQLTSEQIDIECAEAWRICGQPSTTLDRFGKVIEGLVVVMIRAPEADVVKLEAAIDNAQRRMNLLALKPLYDLKRKWGS